MLFLSERALVEHGFQASSKKPNEFTVTTLITIFFFCIFKIIRLHTQKRFMSFAYYYKKVHRMSFDFLLLFAQSDKSNQKKYKLKSQRRHWLGRQCQ